VRRGPVTPTDRPAGRWARLTGRASYRGDTGRRAAELGRSGRRI